MRRTSASHRVGTKRGASQVETAARPVRRGAERDLCSRGQRLFIGGAAGGGLLTAGCLVCVRRSPPVERAVRECQRAAGLAGAAGAYPAPLEVCKRWLEGGGLTCGGSEIL